MISGPKLSSRPQPLMSLKPRCTKAYSTAPPARSALKGQLHEHEHRVLARSSRQALVRRSLVPRGLDHMAASGRPPGVCLAVAASARWSELQSLGQAGRRAPARCPAYGCQQGRLASGSQQDRRSTAGRTTREPHGVLQLRRIPGKNSGLHLTSGIRKAEGGRNSRCPLASRMGLLFDQAVSTGDERLQPGHRDLAWQQHVLQRQGGSVDGARQQRPCDAGSRSSYPHQA